jgi:chemotaxis protein CheY-P-specific phosphatase CheC
MHEHMEVHYKNELHKAAVLAAQKASEALEHLIAPKTRLIVSDVEVLEKPEEVDAQKLAERCITYYKEDKTIIASKIKIYEDDGRKKDAGLMMMFMEESDIDALSTLILKRVKTDELRTQYGMRESAITEALNIIGNAYIESVAHYYKKTIMSMVPTIIDAMEFDKFIGEILAASSRKTYVIFDTDLLVTRSAIKIPFLLAVALWE